MKQIKYLQKYRMMRVANLLRFVCYGLLGSPNVTTIRKKRMKTDKSKIEKDVSVRTCRFTFCSIRNSLLDVPYGLHDIA